MSNVKLFFLNFQLKQKNCGTNHLISVLEYNVLRVQLTLELCFHNDKMKIIK